MENNICTHRPQGCTRMMIYDFINAYTGDHGYPPTLREIANGVGIRSLGTICQHMKILEREHLIIRHKNMARAIHIQQSAL